jgi:predicted ArsR family transcriptional regulator
MLGARLKFMENDMVNPISDRQDQILKLLLENKNGMTLDEIAGALSISRNAVQQHFNALERDGFVQAGAVNKTAGRPARSFVLTDAGVKIL